MKIEKEVKVLDIDIPSTIKSLEKIGASFKFKDIQKIYVYDLPSIYHRYLEILDLLKEKKFPQNVLREKLDTLLYEIEDLAEIEEIDEFLKYTSLEHIHSLLSLTLDNLISALECNQFKNIVKKLYINPNKWLRLRESHGKIELTSKHVFQKNNNFIQHVLENEVSVSSLENMNLLLKSLGFVRRNYQEKLRIQYLYKNAEIDIDVWPHLDPYLEIESDDTSLIEEIIEKCDLKRYKIVSQNTESLYKQKGIDVLSITELRFEKIPEIEK